MRRLVLLAVFLIGCGELAPPSSDLVARFPSARLGTDTGLIDFGVPAGRPHLLSGFGLDEQGILWSTGTRSILEFHLSAPRDLPLIVSCAPFTFPNAPPQTVTFELNGHPGPRIELREGMANYPVRLPAAATRRGWNRLTLRYAWSRPPFEVLPSADRRRLAVAWDFMLFEDDLTGPRLPPLADAADGTLTIPPGTSLSYYVNPPRGARLALEQVSLSTGSATTFTILLEGDGGRTERLALVQRPSRAWEIPLPHGWSGPLRLSFQADGGTVRLVRPRLLTSEVVTTSPALGQARPTRRPNVLVYLVDTLRADRLGSYGHDGPSSPHTDALAEDGIVFTEAMAESSWTRSSVASLFTGLSPRRHAVYGRFDALHERAITLAGILRAAGYETAGFLTNGNVAEPFGFAQGFDAYELLPGAIVPGSQGIVTEPLPESDDLDVRARRWLRARNGEKPFFLYLHAADPHGPYQPPDRFRRRLGVPDADAKAGTLWRLQDLHAHKVPVYADTPAKLLGLYDAEVAQNDHALGKLLAYLKRRGLYDDLLVVVVADHGEEFHEHGGWEHGKTLYREVVKVPLIVKLPGGAHAGRRVDVSAQLADVLPTLLAALGLDVPEGLDGADLIARIDENGAHAPRPAFGQIKLDGYVADAVEDGPWKLVTGWMGIELFDRRADPGERRNLVETHLETAGYLRAKLEERSAATGDVAPRAATVPPAVLENLRALGYVQ